MVRLLIFSLAFTFSFSTFASDCGLFRVVKGKVSYQKKNKSKFSKARINKKVCSGDTVKTADTSRAKIVMNDGNEINISPNTSLLIEIYKTNTVKKEKKVLLNVLYGKIRSNVKQKYKDSEKSHYRVKTKSAVAGVRGTEFMTSFNQATNQSKFVTFEGEVAVGKFQANKFIPEVSVKPGQFTSNTGNEALHPAKNVPAKEFSIMEQETNFGGDSDNRGVATDQANPPTQEEQKDEPKAEQQQKDQPQSDSGELGANESDAPSSGTVAGDREPASADPMSGPEMGLPEPDLEAMPEISQMPKAPPQIRDTRDMLDNMPIVCTQCNDVIQNKKVRLIINATIPGD